MNVSVHKLFAGQILLILIIVMLFNIRNSAQ
jgi:hypothetical protein